MTVEQMLAHGDIVEWRKYLATASAAEAMRLCSMAKRAGQETMAAEAWKIVTKEPGR